MTNDKLKDFLKRLAQDPTLKKRYLADPKQVMTENGIDAAHQDMILKGDSAGISKVLGSTDAICITHINGYKQ
ncbi:MAG: hypothetical protein ACK4E7_09205 [Permianibacter sp.]